LKNIKITLGETQTYVITEYRLKHSHEFDWNNVIILNEKAHFNKRLISEMCYIL